LITPEVDSRMPLLAAAPALLFAASITTPSRAEPAAARGEGGGDAVREDLAPSARGRSRRGPEPPRARRAQGHPRRGVHELRDPAGWPAEPPAPAGAVDAERFARAYASLCGTVASRAADLPEVARAIREVAAEAGADPFLLAALSYRQGFCTPAREGPAGVGLLQIQPAMFAPEASLPFPRGDLAVRKLVDARHNLRVGLALLRMWEAEHEALDRSYGSTPHRGAVAHLIWGDKVWSATGEDRVFTARRRLLDLYGARAREARASWFGFPLVSPLDGAPRLGTSGLGVDRDGGARAHRGLDVDAVIGEPVRAVADGVVQFAGADMPGRQEARWLSPRRSRSWRGRFGPGGIFVRIVHANQVRTGYFHLNSFTVTPGQEVKAGDLIGFVGRTGVKVSNSHLHFEVTQDGRLLDPAAFLGGFVIPPEGTLTHQHAVAEKQQRLAKERRARRKARLEARRRAVPTS
jgi:murein DD-endopeptidase MepM/ murein hydrolase activator NlpD